MRDIQTLHNFVQSYYKNTTDESEKSNRRLLTTILRNMQISNCTVGKVKDIIKKSFTNKDEEFEITASDIIAFLQEEENITKIQEESNLVSFAHSRNTSDTYRARYSGLDTLRAR